MSCVEAPPPPRPDKRPSSSCGSNPLVLRGVPGCVYMNNHISLHAQHEGCVEGSESMEAACAVLRRTEPCGRGLWFVMAFMKASWDRDVRPAQKGDK
jgi:hypothetical protein